MHFINLSHEPLRAVLLSIPVTFVIGLGFGIIRIVTRSLAWGMLIHGTTDAAWEFAKTGAVPEAVSFHRRRLWPRERDDSFHASKAARAHALQ